MSMALLTFTNICPTGPGHKLLLLEEFQVWHEKQSIKISLKSTGRFPLKGLQKGALDQ